MAVAVSREKAVFLDKDGTLVEDVPYNVDPSLIWLAPGVPEGLRLLQEVGFRLVVVTNQSGVARGYFQEEALEGVEKHLCQILSNEGVSLSGFYYCPHHPEGVIPGYAVTCSCRKPEPGMVFRAAQDFRVNLETSWFIGDILNDVECGRRAGTRTILINNGNETEWKISSERWPHFIAGNFLEAAKIIIKYDQVNSINVASFARPERGDFYEL